MAAKCIVDVVDGKIAQCVHCINHFEDKKENINEKKKIYIYITVGVMQAHLTHHGFPPFSHALIVMDDNVSV